MADNENMILEGDIMTSAGVTRLWERTKSSFVRKDGDKVLSDNNFSNAYKQKLDSLEPLEAVTEKVAKAVHLKGSLDTLAELEAVRDPEDGDMYDVKENGHNYVWIDAEERWDDYGETFHIDPLTADDIDLITGYATSPAAFVQILENGGEIELGDNITMDAQQRITKDVVIDLNGNDLSSSVAKSAKQHLFVVDGARLTIKGEGNVTSAFRLGAAENGGEIVIEDGNFTCGDVGFTAAGANASIVMNGGSISAVEGGLGAFDGGDIEINGGTIECEDNFALFTNGSSGRGGNTIVVNDGLLIGNIKSAGYEAIGVYIANNDTFVMNGGEIRANNGAGLCMRAGTVTINDGKIVATGEAGTTGKIGDSNIQMSKSAIIYHESANYPGKGGMNLTINGGEFIGVDHSLEVLSNEVEPAVDVNGGEFTPAYPEN